MRIHLVDGTYELFRHYYSPAAKHPDPTESAAVRGVLGTVVGMAVRLLRGRRDDQVQLGRWEAPTEET